MNEILNPDVAKVFDAYPQNIRKKLLFLRQLVLEVALEEGINDIEETLKWGEPSYLSRDGSTLRLGWKKSQPNQYAMYFHCKTKLISTFKELFSDKFTFEGNRAIVFNEDDKIHVKELKYCILLSLTYHQRKHLLMLDM